MDAPWWFDTFMESPWYDKLFWLFFVGIIVGIAVVWIRVIVEMIRFEMPRPKRTARAKSSGGFSESVPVGSVSFDSSSESGSSDTGSDSGGGGSDFSGGGGESGGGGATGSWS